MTSRIEIATHIYARLIVRDLSYAIAKPEKFAHRALLFADALLLCDKQSAPPELGPHAQPFPRENTISLPMRDLEERAIKRRASRPTLH